MPLKNSSELRQQEHVNSRQFPTKFDGTAETCPYKVGELYDGRPIVSLGFNFYFVWTHISFDSRKR